MIYSSFGLATPTFLGRLSIVNVGTTPTFYGLELYGKLWEDGVGITRIRAVKANQGH